MALLTVEIDTQPPKAKRYSPNIPAEPHTIVTSHEQRAQNHNGLDETEAAIQGQMDGTEAGVVLIAPKGGAGEYEKNERQ